MISFIWCLESKKQANKIQINTQIIKKKKTLRCREKTDGCQKGDECVCVGGGGEWGKWIKGIKRYKLPV